MKNKLIISIAATCAIALTLTLLLVYYPYTPEENEYEIDPTRFTSLIIRNTPDDMYLPLLYSIENITGQDFYFDMLSNDSKNMVQNVSYLIERELEFLEILDPQDFKDNEWRHHNFTYIGSVFPSVNQSEFLSLFDLENFYPYYFFYYNFTTMNYYANSTVSNYYHPDDWGIPEIFDYVYSQNSTSILITQYVRIGDIYAPLAGSGTTFERQILCLATGQPILFLSNEGPWWIS